jgi:hypothetical protein
MRPTGVSRSTDGGLVGFVSVFGAIVTPRLQHNVWVVMKDASNHGPDTTRLHRIADFHDYQFGIDFTSNVKDGVIELVGLLKTGNIVRGRICDL